MNEKELQVAFEGQIPSLLAWGEEVVSRVNRQLKQILEPRRSVEEFLKIPPKPRVKEVESFLTKAFHRKKNYSDPLNEITDKVGVRFVVLLSTDLQLVQTVIENEDLWFFSKDRDFEDEKAKNPQFFDYQSVHYVVRNKTDFERDKILIPSGLSCEIQVRTLLQHAYAELAHDLTYKQPHEVKPQVRREVAKSMALMEATDEIFLKASQLVEADREELRSIHDICSELFNSHVGSPQNQDIRLTNRLLGPYKAEVRDLKKEDLAGFLEKYRFIYDKVKQRADTSYFYRCPCILAIYYLVAHHRLLLQEKWPENPDYLKNPLKDLGFNPDYL